MVDIATRVYNRTWKIDPIVRSVLDTDFYKLLMAQTIFRRYKNIPITFGVHNRTTSVQLADIIDIQELKEQLDHVRTLRLSPGESTWLRGNMFYGKRQMFSPDFLDWMEQFRFPEYELRKKNGQYELTFHGSWIEASSWEIPALTILNELRSRNVLKGMGRFELQVLYARAMSRVWEKIQIIKPLQRLGVADFGTRRRHSFLWQDWCVQAMIEGLGSSFTGTSNCLIAMRREVEAVGTNAHELPMVYAALSNNDEELFNSPYKVLLDWQEDYARNLLVFLPDTFGTANFLAHAPEWVANWTGMRIDSIDPVEGGEMAIRWWQERGQNPTKKLLIFSDGLDVDEIHRIHKQFYGRVRIAYGWGTLLTNDFRNLVPDKALDPVSLVCKVTSAGGRPTVKLSDNPAKAMGPVNEIKRYRRVFDIGDQAERAVIV